ncbi:caspase family protein [Primorskyibacter aestuariivivens]|uniref:caspase family protein n=1 Tax=Primorskyibacter aestuariivivens TaxID=1888912 RepID=UPI002301957E|nr:caspase family protein [Primorskyibacter aestuariivivens]MDA7427072.1 caspase family protein [Primorskyibacter aestuariivivens]
MRSFILCLALILTPLSASAEKRLGLVIGNDNYADVVDLQKARADAEAVSQSLTAQGYAVTTVLDAHRREMNMAVSEFIGQLDPGDTALIFYAGHGVEIDGENYLLPTDIVAPDAGEKYFVKSESIALSALLDRVRATGARTTLAIIDACRDNPFKASNGRSIGGSRGLGRITAPEGTFVIFSAGAGQTALDRLSDNDPVDNSVFTRMLLPRLNTPGVELRDLVSELRRDVRDLARSVGHEQFPAYYDELLGQFYFTPAPAEVAQSTPAPVQKPGGADPMRADFELARSLNTRAAYATFIERYAARQDEFPVQMAMKLRDALTDTDAQEPVPPTEPAPQPVAEPQVEPADRRDILRQTQAQLNALGCNAGIADGISGPRTRAAFRRFLDATGTGIAADELGTARALEAVQALSGTVCKQAAATTRSDSANTATSSRSSASAPAPAPAAPSFSLTGSWRWTASCPLGKATGTTTFRSAGGNSYSGTVNGSAGSGTVRAVLNGRSYSATENFGWVTNQANGSLSSDGRTLSMRVSNGCRVTARKG